MTSSILPSYSDQNVELGWHYDKTGHNYVSNGNARNVCKGLSIALVL